MMDREKTTASETGLEKYKDKSDDELLLLVRGGDSDAEEYLIRKYKDAARTRAHLYFMVGGDREDIVQEGMIGIFKAIRDYDPDKQPSDHHGNQTGRQNEALSAEHIGFPVPSGIGG